jgi:hypothetical protein
MELTLLDKSNYLRGLLILIGKDKNIAIKEKELFLRLSKTLGFSEEFCNNAVNELLVNNYIIEDPPKFSDVEIAKAFLKDGIQLAFADGSLHLYEMNWLNFVGDKNNVDPDWRVEQLNDFKKLGKIERSKIIFEIEKIILTAQVN